MANKRLVWSGGNNTGGFVSGAPVAGDWTNAYTTLQGALTARLAGEEVWMHVGATTPHSESYSSTQVLTCTTSTTTDPVLIKGVDKNNSNVEVTTPPTTINFEVTPGNVEIHFNLNLIVRGIYFSASRNINTANSSDTFGIFQTCRFKFDNRFISSSSGTSFGYVLYENSVFNLPSGGSSKYIYISDGYASFTGCSFTGTYTDSIFQVVNVQFSQVLATGCDFSSLASGQVIVRFDGAASDTVFIELKHCKLPTNYVRTDSTWFPGNRIELINSDSGNVLYMRSKSNYWGLTSTDSSSYLTASDPDKTGSTTGQRISFKMSPRAAQCLRHSPLEGLPIVAYIGSTGSKTFNLQAVENYTTALKDSEAWIDIFYLDDSGSPLWKVATTKVLDDHLEASLPAGDGTGAWTTPPSGSRSVEFEKTVPVNHIGYYQVVPHLGKFESGKVMHCNSQVTVT